MKQLADGTFVSDSTPTKNISGLRYLLTSEEIVERSEADAAAITERKKQAKIEKRQQALAQKWADPFSLLDDILDRGVDLVKADRDAIKSANPKD